MGKVTVSIWDKIDPTVVEASTTNESVPDKPASSNRRSWRSVFIAGDILGSLLWTLGLTKLLFFDYDRYLANQLGEPWNKIADFRSLVLLVMLATVLVLHKRSAWALVYAAAFPLVLFLWKMPRLLIAIRSWNLLLALATVVASMFKRFRIRLFLRTVEVTVLFVALMSTTAWLSVICAIVLSTAVLYHYSQALISGVRASKFLKYQQKLIAIVTRPATLNTFKLDPELRSDEVERFTKGQLEKFVNSVSTGLLAVKLLGFYAVLLQRYRRSLSIFALNALTYVWLFLQSIALLAAINFSIYVASPDQFKVEGAASFVKFLFYSMASMFVTTVPQITATGDIAILAALLSAIYGTILLVSLASQLIVSFRQSRDDETLSSLVSQANSERENLSRQLESEYESDLDDVYQRLKDLGLGSAQLFLGFLAKKIPDDLPE